MKTLFSHIEQVKARPHHVRKRIAFAVATGITAVIAFVWLASNVAAGTFALKPTSFADVGAPETLTRSSINGNAQGVAGAAAALGEPTAAAHIEIVDTAPSTPPVKKPEPTTIPF